MASKGSTTPIVAQGAGGGQGILQQMLPMMALSALGKSASDGNGNAGGAGGVKGLILLDVASRALPFIGGLITTWIHGRIRSRTNKLYEIMNMANGPSHMRKKGSVVLERNMKENSQTSPMDDMFDAVLALASDLPQTKFIRRLPSGMFTVETTDDIPIGEGFMFRRIPLANDAEKMVIEVFSYERDIVQIRNFVTEIENKYRVLRNNQLGRALFYFDEFIQSPYTTVDGKTDLSKSAQHLMFSMYNLHTNKSLKHVFGKAMTKVRRRVRFFTENRKWYEEKGVPYTMGVLLHGNPGCGKTSFIKGIAKDANRHIVNIKLTKHTTVSQLTNLFYSGCVHVLSNGVNAVYQLAIDQVIIVIEDIDCLTDIVIRRDKPVGTAGAKGAKGAKEAAKADATKLLMGLPNVLDVIDNVVTMGLPTNAKEQEMFMRNMRSLAKIKEHVDNVAEEETKERITAHKTQEVRDEPQRLTLSVLLNLMDGILETPGRILVITTNHPEKLDPALVRPGRIDALVHFTKCSNSDIQEMITSICDCKLSEDQRDAIDALPEYAWTPAEVSQIIFEHEAADINEILVTLNKPPKPEPTDEADEAEECKDIVEPFKNLVETIPPQERMEPKKPVKTRLMTYNINDFDNLAETIMKADPRANEVRKQFKDEGPDAFEPMYCNFDEIEDHKMVMHGPGLPGFPK